VKYEATAPCTLTVRPLLAFRDYHGLQRGNAALDRRWSDTNGLIIVRPYEGLPVLRVGHSGRATHDAEGWFWSTEYEVERRRGLDFKEDLWCPGTVSLELASEGHVYFSLRPPEPVPGPRAVEPADTFRVKRADGRPTVIAGYPWF